MESPAQPAEPRQPDAYDLFLSQSQPIPRIQGSEETAPRSPSSETRGEKPSEQPLELPGEEVLSLDDAPQVEARRHQPTPHPRRPEPPGWFPPPFRFRIRITADSAHELRGTYRGVLTPHGLFLESKPKQPILFIPPGAPSGSTRHSLTLKLADRTLSVRVVGTSNPKQLAADTAAFLAGERPMPLPAEYRRPWWQAGVGLILAFGLAAAIVVHAEASKLDLIAFLPIAGRFALISVAASSLLAIATRLPSGVKVAGMAAINAALFAFYLFLFTTYFLPPVPAPPPPPPAETLLPPTPPPEPEPEPEEPPPATAQHPPSHYDLIYRDGRTRLDDGPADVTALAISPFDDAVAIGYADGATRYWPLDQPSFEPPTLGPRAIGPVRRIEFIRSKGLIVLTCDAGLVVTPFRGGKVPVLIPGELVAAETERMERFAVVRDGRVQVRLLPVALANEGPPSRAIKGFIRSENRDEARVGGAPRSGFASRGGKPTFLAWDSEGRLLHGEPGGIIRAFPLIRPSRPFVSREHRAPVHAWASSPWGDFATGDDDGFVGFRAAKSNTTRKFKTGDLAIKGMAFNSCGGELAVVDTSGWVTLWDPVTGEKLHELKQKRPIAAISYGPREDVLMIADGPGVEIYWTPDLP